MAATKQTKKKKPMTLEDFAVLIQRDLTRMATKEDLAAFRAEMATNHTVLDNKVSDLAVRISDVKDELSEKIDGLKYAKEIDELRARVNIVEEKLGIKQHKSAGAAT